MKIDLVGPSYPFRGGISHYSTLLFMNLKKRHQVKFYSFKKQYPHFLFPGKSDKDNSQYPLRDDEIDICTLKLFSGTKILFVCHNILEHERSRMKSSISKCVLSRGDYFIVHSGEEKERLIKITGKTRVKVTFHPTYEIFNPGLISRAEARQRLGIGEECCLLFFGFVREYKGLRYLIRAMPEILKYVDARLLIAGEFWERKDVYWEMIRNLNLEEKITVIDRYIPNEETPYFFSASDIVVLPYTSVTGSGLIQLAFGFNKPVVVSRIGALSEVVHHKETGFLVPPRNPREIAEAIVAFFRENRKDEMSQSIQKERKRFSWDRLVQTIETFKEENDR
jgi:glycosyltransferase involved in cell wall biosynthesis